MLLQETVSILLPKLLLQLLFWYTLLKTLPAPRQAFNPLPGVFASNRGIMVPVLQWQDAYGWVLGAAALGLIGTLLWRRHAARRQAATGARPAVWPAALGLLLGVPLLVWAVLGSLLAARTFRWE